MDGGKKEVVKLLSAWPSPYGMRVKVALSLKKVPHEFIEVCPFQKPEILLKHNPIYKKIPVLVHGDRDICESMIIVQYIDEVWKDNGSPSILPSDPYDAAMARFWATFVDDKMFPGLKEMAAAETAMDGKAAAEKLMDVLKVLEGALEKCSNKGEKAFFGGDRIGYVDLALGGFISWLRAAGAMLGMEFFGEEETPLLAAWVERFCAEEAVKDVMPDTGKMLDFFQNVLIKMMKGSSGQP